MRDWKLEDMITQLDQQVDDLKRFIETKPSDEAVDEYLAEVREVMANTGTQEAAEALRDMLEDDEDLPPFY